MTWQNWPLYDRNKVGNLYTQDALKDLSPDALRTMLAQARVLEVLFRMLGRYEGLPVELRNAYEELEQKATWEIEVIGIELSQREEE
ncbi:MAG: hypothetical protein IJV47_02440 [Candidatus Methanomethylophilaceae archaeon]|nr:hypothetical protein [Candidatus Methanomethylophilaceae archaeon]MBQ9689455.1 hypothetical protein [Candidatus Methanomethylophilaceae archaeon]